MTEITTTNTMTEIVDAYNELTGKSIKKFSSKAVGVLRYNNAKVEMARTSEDTSTDLTSEILSSLESHGALFTPEESDIHMPNGDVIPDKKAIVNADNDNEYIATVGRTYQLIPNLDVFTQFGNVLKESGLDHTDMEIQVSNTKARTYVKFIFPAHQVEVRPNDFVNLMITGRNSYDGSTRFILDIGGFRLLCSNGMGIGRYTNVYSNKHSSGFSHDKMAAYLETAIEVFTTAGKEWQQMSNEEVTKEQVLEVISMMVERKSKLTYDEVMEGRECILKESLRIYEQYEKEMGTNRFALLNAVTHLSTHVATSSGDIVGLRIHKDKMRDKTLNSAAFKVRKVA